MGLICTHAFATCCVSVCWVHCVYRTHLRREQELLSSIYGCLFLAKILEKVFGCILSAEILHAACVIYSPFCAWQPQSQVVRFRSFHPPNPGVWQDVWQRLFCFCDSLFSPKALQRGHCICPSPNGISAPSSCQEKQPSASEAIVHVMSTMSVVVE